MEARFSFPIREGNRWQTKDLGMTLPPRITRRTDGVHLPRFISGAGKARVEVVTLLYYSAALLRNRRLDFGAGERILSPIPARPPPAISDVPRLLDICTVGGSSRQSRKSPTGNCLRKMWVWTTPGSTRTVEFHSRYP